VGGTIEELDGVVQGILDSQPATGFLKGELVFDVDIDGCGVGHYLLHFSY
jgi:hypothetical protein